MKSSLVKIFGAFALSFMFFLSVHAQPLNNSEFDKVVGAMQVISYFYVDTVKMDKLAEDAIVGMLKELDPHCSYISKDDLKEANAPLEGSFEGIGVQFQITNDTIFIIAPVSGGPSEKLGIQAGDKIIKIEGINVAGVKIKNEDVFKKLRGPKGTKVTITVLKVGSTKTADYTITRDKIPDYSVVASYMISEDIGYIKVDRFSVTTAEEFHNALEKLNDKGMKNLILDLTGNGGGIMQAAVEMADEFLGDKKLIVYQQGVRTPKLENYATSKGIFEKGKLAVMVDQYSASASEIVSGALQDWDRALIIGRRSYGKGLVQKPYSLSDGSQIRLTVARYYTPVGRNIQKSYKEGLEEYSKDLSNRSKHGEYFSADSIHFPDSLKFYTPNKRLVYGGGGIMPDIFVSEDTSKNSSYLLNLYRKGIFNQFSLNYVDRERSKLTSAYPTAHEFVKSFTITNELMTRFFDFAAKDSVKKDEQGFETSKEIIQSFIKGRIAGDLYGNDAFYEVINRTNPIFIKALAAMKDDSFTRMRISGQ